MKKAILGSLGIMTAVLVFPAVTLADAPEKTEGFVCPVITQDAVGDNNPNAVEIGQGNYSVIGPNVTVPLHATNGDGAGTPPGPHSEPGDSDYTAIWAGE